MYFVDVLIALDTINGDSDEAAKICNMEAAQNTTITLVTVTFEDLFTSRVKTYIRPICQFLL